ncbi:glycerophosphodiester phosphodiesterase family protein [Palleronia sp.]|uniref:glycerophosphodiester phosphodiesterase family protein n=1 Tax=Palleronia sp. TaxID=1940284 RepID=UPI0035C872B8
MTEIASHRGGAALWPENSERAFRETLALGVEQIEFDVRLSADGVPVIFHDATLDRVTNGTGPVSALNVGDLKRLEITGGGGKIMTLEEGARILAESDIVLRCEIKPDGEMRPYPGLVDLTFATLAALRLIDRTIVTSFHLEILGDVRSRSAPLADIMWLVASPLARLIGPARLTALCRHEQIGSLSLHHADLDDLTLTEFRSAGLSVGAFGVYDDEAISSAFRRALSVFTTDRPDAALRLRPASETSV